MFTLANTKPSFFGHFVAVQVTSSSILAADAPVFGLSNAPSVADKDLSRLDELNAELKRLVNYSKPVDVNAHCRNFIIENVRPNEETYSLLLSMNERYGWITESLELFEDMRRSGLRPSLETYHTLLRTVAKSRPKYPKLRENIMEDLKNDGFEPTATTFEHYVSALVAHGELEHAADVLEMMEKNEITPTMLTYATILQSATAFNEAVFAGELLQKMEKVHHPLSSALYIDVLRLSTLEKKPLLVEHCWKKAIEFKGDVDDGLCAYILQLAGRTGNTSLATSVAKYLIDKEAPLDEHHYASLIAAFARNGKIREAVLALGIMRNRGIAPNEYTSEGITDFAQYSHVRVQEALLLLRDLHDQKHFVDIEAINALIRACKVLTKRDGPKKGKFMAGTMADVDFADIIYRTASELDLTPDTNTLNALLHVLTRTGNLYMAESYLNDFQAKGVEFNVVTYSRMIEIMCMQINYEKAFVYLEEMKKKNIVPPANVYRHIIRKCAYNNDPRASIAIQEMESLGYKATSDLLSFTQAETKHEIKGLSRRSRMSDQRQERVLWGVDVDEPRKEDVYVADDETIGAEAHMANQMDHEPSREKRRQKSRNDHEKLLALFEGWN
ncbi:8520_t:CDS:2 [Paraglomus occultum]|uniref:8520_t:CDS:1 n=1 Tax=Paraglomus occultum TaxID=144539 RepID=A0A9N8WC36_9GLOM|nr:8520_t:CDS:2 [Paraglomus occultum]